MQPFDDCRPTLRMSLVPVSYTHLDVYKRQRWGLGADLNWVAQRDYDDPFGFDYYDYDVVTGHASLYWDTGYYGLEAQIDAGRYLAGDWGSTFTLTRRFPNGLSFIHI